MARSVALAILLVSFFITMMSARGGDILSTPEVKMEAKETVNLRDSPPSKYFYSMGNKIATIRKGETVKAIEEKTVHTLFGDYVWLKVERLNPKNRSEPTNGWVYLGKPDSPKNFVVVPEAGPAERKEVK
jgi:hypothetical protein